MQIREHAEAASEKPAVIVCPSGTVVTFGELEARANRLAHFFRSNGLREGDVVAILMENNEHYHAVMWAARRSGLYYVPINTHLTAAEVAYILDTDIAETRKLTDIAGREMAAEIATDVLIIEDETFIAMDLESLVRNLGHNVIGVARTHSDAVALAKNKKPGLILADIQLADGSSGLDAVNELLKVFEVPVVFITAYPERFLTGERPEPAFLISKPFQPAMVSAVASQALFFQRNSRNRAPRAASA